jgi:3-oxoacyl-[acyl-carrier-protein] synthase-3
MVVTNARTPERPPGTPGTPGTTAGVIAGWGVALPPTVVTNTHLEAFLDTTDAWITERTGIRRRRIGGTTAELAADAGRRAIHRAGLSACDIDHVLLATTTPDRAVPATASEVQERLGVRGGACDLNAACSGFVYGLVHAHGLLGLGLRRVLLVGAETMSRITDAGDRGTAILFGDGAGAVVLEARPGPPSLLGWDLGSDGSAAGLLSADIGGVLRMDGPEVFRRAVRTTVSSAQAALDRAGVGAGDLALVVPHQANVRIIAAVCERLGVPVERAVTVLEWTGNTSAASIPLALADAADRGRLADGDLVLLAGFGAGLTWASAVLRWHDPRRHGGTTTAESDAR